MSVVVAPSPLQLKWEPTPSLLPSSPSASWSSFQRLASIATSLQLIPVGCHLKNIHTLGMDVISHVKGRGRMLVKAAVSSEVIRDSGEDFTDSDDEAFPFDERLLDAKLQRKLEQKMKKKLTKRIRLRRKKLVHKRRMRKRGRWPPSKLKH